LLSDLCANASSKKFLENLFSIQPLKILAHFRFGTGARIAKCALYYWHDSVISSGSRIIIPTIAIFRHDPASGGRGEYVLVFHEPSDDLIYNAAAVYV
jgi:hypothetical protein